MNKHGSEEEFNGTFCRGRGNVEFLKMLDDAWSAIDGPGQNLMMLHSKERDLFYEGADWPGVWTQNTYGMYTWTPIMPPEPFRILDNSYNLWFANQGDGKRMGQHDVVPPAGALMDCVGLDGHVHYVQGDGKWGIHDFFLEGTLSGVLCKAENLLASRDLAAIAEYLPKMELALDLVWARRDPASGLLKTGTASNLLAPNYAGTLMPDGTYGPGYLSGMLVTFAAASDRVVELEKMAGRQEKARDYAERKRLAVEALLKNMLEPEGYLIKYIDLNGERHGVFGADNWGYFCSSPNHDAVAHRIVDDNTARKIYEKIRSIPGLRPHGFICANYPGLDDTYEGWGIREPLPGIWKAGHWVNGGAWFTCEARMVMAYYRVGAWEDLLRSVNLVVNDLRDGYGCSVRTDWGAGRYFEGKGHLELDTFGVIGAALRGVFEYWYSAESLKLYPHVPPDVEMYEQLQPARFGDKKLFLSVNGTGSSVKSAKLDGDDIPVSAHGAVVVEYSRMKDKSKIEIER